jgi:hypothetical protein
MSDPRVWQVTPAVTETMVLQEWPVIAVLRELLDILENVEEQVALVPRVKREDMVIQAIPVFKA